MSSAPWNVISMMKKILPLLLGLAVLVSGCLSLPGDEPDPVDDKDVDDVDNTDATGDNTDTGDAGDDSDSSDIDNETVNEPPVASLVANLTEGKANLTVMFDLDGSDADDDALTWILDLGDGTSESGSELPVSYEHTYTQVGNMSVVLEVSDGTDTMTATEMVTVREPDVFFNGSALLADPFAVAGEGCIAADMIAFAESPENPFGDEHSIEPTLWGWDFVLTGGDGLIAEFWDSDLEFLDRGDEGEVPADSSYVIVCIEEPDTSDVDYTLTLSA